MTSMWNMFAMMMLGACRRCCACARKTRSGKSIPCAARRTPSKEISCIAFSIPFLRAQVSPQDVKSRCAPAAQYEFLSYGLTAAWLILVIYVLMMVSRASAS